MTEQHNHHCILSFDDYNWWIISAAPNKLEIARRVDQYAVIIQIVNTSRVDWKDYCKAAVEWDYDNYDPS